LIVGIVPIAVWFKSSGLWLGLSLLWGRPTGGNQGGLTGVHLWKGIRRCGPWVGDGGKNSCSWCPGENPSPRDLRQSPWGAKLFLSPHPVRPELLRSGAWALWALKLRGLTSWALELRGIDLLSSKAQWIGLLALQCHMLKCAAL